ncbi:hypothetical protein LguiA_013849 [Lonicera macranthoides]
MARSFRFLSGTNSSTSLPESAEPPEAVAVESDFVVILAALLCALICVVGLVAVARCAWLRRSTVASANSRQTTHPAANKGMKKKVLKSLPKFTYNSESSGNVAAGNLAGDCAICLTEYSDGDEIRVLPQCGHGFHVACIDMWLGSHSSCPSCRQILVVSRCRKCGEYPEIAGAPTEAELKARQDVAAASSGFLP